MRTFLFVLLSCALVHHGYSAPSDVCDLELVTGPCMALFRKYGFDKATGECKEFTYGGCQGNGNSFDTLAECQRRCPKRKPTC